MVIQPVFLSDMGLAQCRVIRMTQAVVRNSDFYGHKGALACLPLFFRGERTLAGFGRYSDQPTI